MRILVVNAGSSSLKLTLLSGADEVLGAWELDAPRAEVEPHELRDALGGGLDAADAVAHRIVHGGEGFREAVVIDAGVEVQLRALTALAPLHRAAGIERLVVSTYQSVSGAGQAGLHELLPRAGEVAVERWASFRET